MDPNFKNPAIFSETSEPSTPSSGTLAVYAATDGTLRTKNDSGVVVNIGTTGSTFTTVNSNSASWSSVYTTVNSTSANVAKGCIGITIDGGGSAITTGYKGFISIPYAATITAATLLGDTSGTLVIDIWKDTYANYPPTDADSITGGNEPHLTATSKYTDSTLTGWTTSIAAGDVLAFNVDAAATITKATLTLTVTKS